MLVLEPVCSKKYNFNNYGNERKVKERENGEEMKKCKDG